MQERFSPYLEFDHKPAGKELGAVLGPDFASSDVAYQETEDEIRLGPPRIPIRPILIFLILFAGSLTAAPWILPEFGVEMPGHLTTGWILAMSILLIAA